VHAIDRNALRRRWSNGAQLAYGWRWSDPDDFAGVATISASCP